MIYFRIQMVDRQGRGITRGEEAEANEQHKGIIGTLRAAALEWEFEQINFVVGNRGSVVESDFYTKYRSADRLLKATSTPSLKILM